MKMSWVAKRRPMIVPVQMMLVTGSASTPPRACAVLSAGRAGPLSMGGHASCVVAPSHSRGRVPYRTVLKYGKGSGLNFVIFLVSYIIRT